MIEHFFSLFQYTGLGATCETLLHSEMSVIYTHPIILNGGETHTNKLLNNASEPISYKFFVPQNIAGVTLKITLLNNEDGEIVGGIGGGSTANGNSITNEWCLTDNCPCVNIYVQAHSLPTRDSYMQNAILYSNQTNEQIIEFYPEEGAWHYVDMEFIAICGGSETNGDGGTSNSVNSSTTEDGNSSTIEIFESLDFTFEIIFHELDDVIENIGNEIQPLFLEHRLFESYPLLRQTYREFFMFDYDLLPDVNGTVPPSLNLTSGIPSLFKFDVGDVYDIGGTLSFAVAMKNVLKNGYYDDGVNGKATSDARSESQAVAEKLIDPREKDEKVNVVRTNQTVIICMRLGEPGVPTWPDKCTYGRDILPAASVINNTDSDTSTGLVHVPFPESGSWFVTMGLFCHGIEATARVTIIDSVKDFIKKYIHILNDTRLPCPCAEKWEYYKACIPHEKCLSSLGENEILKVKECMMDSKCTLKYRDLTRKFEDHHKQRTEQSLVLSETPCNASVVFTISSSPCVAGRCGRYGRCYHYMSGGFVFSTCLCIKGYRGWDCTEDSEVPSSFSILMASLFLTLSNLLFIPSVYIAAHRKYYTEAVIYFFTMFFSAFYHACDSGEDEFSFCLVKLGVLQFADFYCSLLAIWVTLIAMAHIRPTLVSLLHMFGAILLAFGTELDKQSLWVFLAPALTGICLISASWGMRCRKTRSWFPARNYLAVYLPIGTVLVMIGLVCFAFLQTKQNYHIVHSIWHMVMALSILCLLPNRKTFVPKC